MRPFMAYIYTISIDIVSDKIPGMINRYLIYRK